MRLVLPLAFFIVLGCTPSKNSFKKEYKKIWLEMIKSQAWKNTLKENTTTVAENNMDFYASNTDEVLVKTNDLTTLEDNRAFTEEYDGWVSRAYYKIIKEAEEADYRLKEEYERLNAVNTLSNDQNVTEAFKEKLALINKRYHAHRDMLEGLRSWNIFSEYRTGDLEYFKDENQEEVYQLRQNNAGEQQIIGFLMYKLADLYHSNE
ncbi:MAG: hypothetical protein AAFO99_00230 [Bacteroidota bacterium]